MTEYIQTYFDSNLQNLESDLHKLSLDDITNNHQLQEIKETYRNKLIQNLTEKTHDILYYCDRYLDQWFNKSLHTIKELHKKRPHIIETMEQLKQLWLQI